MEVNLFNLTQNVDMSKAPFRQGVLDYSHLDYADVLDAVGASLFMTSLTALFLQFPSIVFGFSTRTLSIRSLFERSLIPNAGLAINTWFRSSRMRGNLCFVSSAFVVAGVLQLLLLVMEATVVFSASSTIRPVSFEELNFKNIQLAPFSDMQTLVKRGPDCLSLFNADSSLAIPESNFCFLYGSRVGFIRDNYTVKLCLSSSSIFAQSSLSISTDREISWRPVLYFFPRGRKNELIYLDVTSSISDPANFTNWIGRSVAKRFHCRVVFQESSYENCSIVSDCALGNDEIYENTASLILRSSIKLSDRPLSRHDFTVRIINGSDSTSRSGELATNIDWDNFAHYQSSQISGYWMWIGSFILFLVSFLLATTAPDIQLAKAVAVAQYAPLQTLPLHTHKHTCVSINQRDASVHKH